RNPEDSRGARVLDAKVIAPALLLNLPRMLAGVAVGLNRSLSGGLQQPALWLAMPTWLRSARAAGARCELLTMMLLWSSRELRLYQ
ncbi:thiamine/thiamine pyrophosphate ABC transporter permease ThiP, partial [Erwinia amylovora]|nr:thiamine/thiamine pyrophosphate ABC transporter permease ThiP [Erwinia amylovora]